MIPLGVPAAVPPWRPAGRLGPSSICKSPIHPAACMASRLAARGSRPARRYIPTLVRLVGCGPVSNFVVPVIFESAADYRPLVQESESLDRISLGAIRRMPRIGGRSKMSPSLSLFPSAALGACEFRASNPNVAPDGGERSSYCHWNGQERRRSGQSSWIQPLSPARCGLCRSRSFAAIRQAVVGAWPDRESRSAFIGFHYNKRKEPGLEAWR